MPGDYSRFSFNPFEDHLAVLLQQGRVVLDADFNELVQILERRIRVGTLDTFGRCVVPKETPDGFRIQIAGSTVTIGRGRIYVHGLLAENHGKSPLAYDPRLGEQFGTLPIPYDEQPYMIDPPAVAPMPPKGGPHLLYIDVWQREITHLEDPDLVEKAVAVDTAARLQTAWQVRALANVGPITCDTPDDKIPGWPPIIAPSAGRLTTDAVGVPASTDPCILNPVGGYRGTENRLYRVEIHSRGAQGGPTTWKWSRDNNSIGAAVLGINAGLDQLTVDRTRRDVVRGFHPNDWIEITDDRHEFAFVPGVMRKVLQVDDVTGTMTLAAALPAGEFDVADPQSRHTRVRRWDQKGLVLDPANNPVADVDANAGVIPVVIGQQYILEDGVQVTFSLEPAGGAFRVGDYWAFAARTVDASVETLTEAPPRGIKHHYCRLAVVTFPGTVLDCRILWPPDVGDHDHGCDCTACVTAASHNSGTFTIQMAIDDVIAAGGGKICLEVGAYALREPLRIRKAQSVRIVGKGGATQLRAEATAVEISDSRDIALERFAVSCRGGDVDGALLVRSSSQVRLEYLQILVESDNGAAIGLSGALTGVTIRDNAMRAPVGIVNLPEKLTGGTGLMDLRIEDNQFLCRRVAIRLTDVSVHQHVSRIAGNRVTESVEMGFLLTGATVPGFGLEVTGNEFNILGDGIVAGIDGLRVLNNDLTLLKPTANKQRAIVLTKGMAGDRLGDVQVVGNRIIGFGLGINSDVPLGSVSIMRNQIADANVGLLMQAAFLESLSIDNNQMSNIIENALFVEYAEGRIAARGNQLEIIAGRPGVRILCRGGDCVYSDNHSRHIKPADKEGVLLTARTLVVSSNRVLGRVIMHLQPEKLSCTVVGNITGADILVNGAALTPPWVPLNLQNV